ncbi:hypothetical protein BM1_09216 [Bipolaris maydis]|nr:hypothetical protein BM1_09216 [Bipolaris maydis]
MCDSTFTFGQRGSHFFQCPSAREYTRLPPKLSRLLESPKLQSIHHLTLGFEDSFILTYRSTTGTSHLESSGPLPPDLVSFIHAPNRNLAQLRCYLGPYNSSFFTHDSSSYLWQNLPPALVSALEKNIKNGKWLDRPRILALGADATFVFITEKNAAVCQLPCYPSLRTLLEEKMEDDRVRDVQAVTLHPYRYASFLLLLKDGTLLAANIPKHHQPALDAMREPLKNDSKESQTAWMQRRDSAKVERPQQRPSVLQQRAQLRREWGDRTSEVSVQGKGVKLSFSLSVSLGGGLGRLLG